MEARRRDSELQLSQNEGARQSEHTGDKYHSMHTLRRVCFGSRQELDYDTPNRKRRKWKPQHSFKLMEDEMVWY
jgi:hypothetical protein